MMPGTTVSAPSTEKFIATLRARCALRGIALSVIDDDRGRTEYIVTQGAWTRAFNTMSDLESWVDRIEGQAT